MYTPAVQRPDLWRIATINIWNRQGPWEQRLPLLRDQLLALDADAIGFQEVLAFPGQPSQVDDIARGTDWNIFYAPAWHVGGGLTFGNAIASRHPLADTQCLALPTPSGLETRSVAFARVAAPHGPIPLFITHLTFQPHLAHVRVQQVRALAAHVSHLAPIDGPPPVLAGDFNADPDSDEMRFLRGAHCIDNTSVYFADCWWATAQPTPGHTYDRRNAYALRSREPSRRIDYVYVRGPDRHLRGEPLATRIALAEPTDGIWPSDHFAVVADIAAARRAHDPGV